VLGYVLIYGATHAARARAASLDRIVPELGYVKGNIAVISNRANSLKSNATLEELERLCAWLKSVSRQLQSVA
jgi:hypothetical protein